MFYESMLYIGVTDLMNEFMKLEIWVLSGFYEYHVGPTELSSSL